MAKYLMLEKFLMWVVAVSSVYGYTDDHDDWRIVGGVKVNHGELPYQVRIASDDKHVCGATLLDNQWALSAAHCFNGQPDSKFTFFLGENGMNDVNGYVQKFKAEKIINHPLFDPQIVSHDIALIKFNGKVNINRYAAPLPLPERYEKFSVGLMCIASGYGAIYEGGPNADVLQKVNLPIVSMPTCIGAYGKAMLNSVQNICAGYSYGQKDSCNRDSGGPFVCRNRNGQYVATGVVSWGQGCARAGSYGVYTNVASYIDWINSIKRKYS